MGITSEFIGQVFDDGSALAGSCITANANQHSFVARRAAKYLRGIDTVHVSVWGRWSGLDHENLLATLTETKAKAYASRATTLGEHRGVCLEVSPWGTSDGPGFPFVCFVDGVRICLSNRPEPGRSHNVGIQIQGAVMKRFGWDVMRAWDHVVSILAKLGCRIDRNTVSRADPFIDLVGTRSSAFRKIKHWVCRAKFRRKFRSVDYDDVVGQLIVAQREGKAAFMSLCSSMWEQRATDEYSQIVDALKEGAFDSIEFGNGRGGDGIQFGKGARVLRIYDKQGQLRSKYPERIPEMLAVWGCDAETPVTRVEYQVRTNGLREVGIESIEDLARLQGQLVTYLVDQWAVGLSKYDQANKSRRVVSGLWRKVQNAFTEVKGQDPWDVPEPSAGEAPADDGFGASEKPIEREATRFANTAASWMRGSLIRGFDDIQNPSELRRACYAVVDRVFETKGEDRMFGEYVDRRISYRNRCGQQTADEGWRIPKTQAEMVDDALAWYDADPPAYVRFGQGQLV